MGRASILVVDDERGVRSLCRDVLTREGYTVTIAESGVEALRLYAEAPCDLVLTDIKMPEMDGITLCRRLRELDPEQTVVLFTAYPSIDNAIRGMKEGARDYVTKPFTPDALRLVVARALEERDLRDENARLRDNLRSQHGFDTLIGNGAAMQHLKATARKVAASDATALIEGESGTGKELLARAIHVHSPRASRPFVAVNCGSLVGTLLESELFGHVKGAFTGAVASKIGLATAANGGTLFLDEVGELALDMQPKLLRLLQEGEVKPVGGVETRHVDVRVVAATNCDLALAVEQGRFREDLYYRLNVISLPIPPLRERAEDIPLLAHAFIGRASAKANRPIEGITAAGLAHLQAQRWPGNVRELENVIERAAILASSPVLDVHDLGGAPAGAPAASEMPAHVAAAPVRVAVAKPYPFEGLALEEVERQHIERVMREVGGQKGRAAEVLGINRTTLWKKLRRYELEADDASED